MDANRWKEIDELLDAVLDLPESERNDFLSARCKEDQDLKNEILTLLKAQDRTNNFLEKSAMGIAAQKIAHEQNLTSTKHFIGKNVGTYKIEKLLGSGGMGQVYLAHDKKLNRKIALKILPAEYTTNDERIKRFKMEARAVSALNHPYIVTVYDVGTEDGISYIATEYVEGKTLRELIGSNLKTREILEIIIQSTEALSAAHKAKIIHRDIKPENIIFRPDGYVKVLDFGLAKLLEPDLNLNPDFAKTGKGMIMGTPAYMSPEQVGDEKVDRRTDLWSLSLVLYEMLTGINPFKKSTKQATFHAILTEEPPLPSSIKPDILPEIDKILFKALEKNPDLSYQTASDLGADLKRAKRELDSSPSLNSSALSIENKSLQIPKLLLALIGIFFLLMLIEIPIWYFVFRSSPINKGIDWGKANNSQLTYQNGIEYFPSLAPDGSSFVFASDQVGNFDIYSQRVGGKNIKNLTESSTADDTQPAYSPDGKYIAFRSERSPAGIYVMEATGENLNRVSEIGFHPSWSPDSKEIVVSTFGMSAPNVRSGVNNSIQIINIETRQKRVLINQDGSFPTWSPNGKRVAYWFYPSALGRRDIATIAADGSGEPIVLTDNFGSSNWNPVWSPDGKFLYFVSDKNGNWNVWRIAIDENTGKALSEPETIGVPSKSSRHLAFSADGKKMIYVQYESQSNIQGVEFDEKNEKIIGTPNWVTSGDREVTRAELSPDGKLFLMRQIRRTQDDIVVVNRDGSNWRDITNDLYFDRYPRWSPDGSQIAFASDRSGSFEIWIANNDGTNLRQITFSTDSSTGTSFPVWSPDGKRLSYQRGFDSFIIDLSKNWNEQTPFKLPKSQNGNAFVPWDWSADGKKLVGTFRLDGSLGVYSLETNSFTYFTQAKESIPAWLPDSRRFVFPLDNKIFLVDLETKKIKELLTIQPENPRSPFVSSDGKFLYYVAHFNKSDIWLMDATQNQ